MAKSAAQREKQRLKRKAKRANKGQAQGSNNGQKKSGGANRTAPPTASKRYNLQSSLAFEGFNNIPAQAYTRKGAVDDIDLIVACMALPDQAPSLRIAPGDASRSARGQTFERLDVPWSAAVEKDTVVAFVQRCAECAYIYKIWNDALALYTYTPLLVNTAAGHEDDGPTAVAHINLSRSVESLQWSEATNTALGDFAPHGDTYLAGAVTNSIGCFIPLMEGDHAFANLTFTGLGAATPTVSLILDRWTPQNGLQQEIERVDVAFSSGSPTGSLDITVSKTGYYAARIASDYETPVQISMQFFGNPPIIYGHRCMPEYDEFVRKTSGVVPTGCALMYSNRAAPGYRQGEIVSFQIPKGQHWMDYTEFDTVFSAEGSVPMQISEGMYAPLKVSDVSELQFQTNVRVRDKIVVQSRWPCDGGKPVMVMAAKVALVENAPNPRDGFWSFLFNFQFQTASKWFEKEYGTYKNQQIQEAIDRFKWMPAATENPKHLAKMIKAIRSVGDHTIKGISKYGPSVIDGANTAMQLASMFGS